MSFIPKRIYQGLVLVAKAQRYAISLGRIMARQRGRLAYPLRVHLW